MLRNGRLAVPGASPLPATDIPDWYWLANGIPAPQREYLFHPSRQWRLDFAWPAQLVAVEIEGGIWKKGRHVRGRGYRDDLEKYNALALAGWRLLRFEPGRVGYEKIKEALGKAI